MARCVLVAGCGYVGAALAVQLIRRGDRVYGLRRDPAALPDGVLPLAADLTSASSLKRIPSDVEQVVFAAAASERSEPGYRAIYVDGLSRLLDTLSARSIERMLFTSSTAVYGQDDGSWVDETSPTEPTRFSGRILREAERVLAGASMPTATLRLAGIYGPSRTWLVRRVADRVATVRGDGAAPRYANRIHRDDCAGALAHLLAVADLEPVYVGVDDAPAPLSEVHAFVAELLGVDLPIGAPGVGRGGNKRCRASALLRCGWAPAIPSFREGYPPIVRAYLRGRA